MTRKARRCRSPRACCCWRRASAPACCGVFAGERRSIGLRLRGSRAKACTTLKRGHSFRSVCRVCPMVSSLSLRDFRARALARSAMLAMVLVLGCGLGAGQPANDRQSTVGTAAPAQVPARSSGGAPMVAWSQAAGSLAEFRDLQFTLVIDGTRLPLDDFACKKQPAVLAFDCQAPL